MTNLFYPLRRTLFVVALIATISMVAVAGLAVRNAVHTPRRYAVFTVQSGERLSSLWSRLETNGVASRAALTRLAATAPFSAYPFVPPREGDPRRFEGLFVPGHYRIALPAQRGVRRDIADASAGPSAGHRLTCRRPGSGGRRAWPSTEGMIGGPFRGRKGFPALDP